MTLTRFSPDSFDELALRLLDVATIVRSMAHSARENDVQDFQLHGNKAQEWLAHLEAWAHEANDRQSQQIIRERGARRALATALHQGKGALPQGKGEQPQGRGAKLPSKSGTSRRRAVRKKSS